MAEIAESAAVPGEHVRGRLVGCRQDRNELVAAVTTDAVADSHAASE